MSTLNDVMKICCPLSQNMLANHICKMNYFLIIHQVKDVGVKKIMCVYTYIFIHSHGWELQILIGGSQSKQQLFNFLYLTFPLLTDIFIQVPYDFCSRKFLMDCKFGTPKFYKQQLIDHVQFNFVFQKERISRVSFKI